MRRSTGDRPTGCTRARRCRPSPGARPPTLDVGLGARAAVGDGRRAPAVGHQRDVLAFVDDHPDVLLRSCAEGHLTGSALVVDAVGGGGRCSCCTASSVAGSSPAATPTATPAWRRSPCARPPRRPASRASGWSWPAIDVDIHRVEPPGEAPHLHLDTRYLRRRAAEGGRGGQRGVPGPALGHGRRTCADLGVDASTRRLATSRARPRPDARDPWGLTRPQPTSSGGAHSGMSLTSAKFLIGSVDRVAGLVGVRPGTGPGVGRGRAAA